MIKNFHYRLLVIVTFVIGLMFICSIPEMSMTSNWVGLGIGFFVCYLVTYNAFKNLSEERRNEILYLDFFKKIGCDFSKE